MRRNPYPSFHIGKRFNLERRLKRGVIKKAINNLSKMINRRRQTLIWYRQFLELGYHECQQLYTHKTIYARGPVYLAELHKLLAIRKDMWIVYAKI